jgi:hypothetical protein
MRVGKLLFSTNACACSNHISIRNKNNCFIGETLRVRVILNETLIDLRFADVLVNSPAQRGY